MLVQILLPQAGRAALDFEKVELGWQLVRVSKEQQLLMDQTKRARLHAVFAQILTPLAEVTP